MACGQVLYQIESIYRVVLLPQTTAIEQNFKGGSRFLKRKIPGYSAGKTCDHKKKNTKKTQLYFRKNLLLLQGFFRDRAIVNGFRNRELRKKKWCDFAQFFQSSGAACSGPYCVPRIVPFLTRCRA